MTRCLATALCLCLWTACGPPAKAPDETRAIRAVVDRYLASIDAADPVLARQVWAEREDLSFIHPLGHEEGWEQIKSNVYVKLMGGLFSTRKLAIERMISIKPHGDLAVVQFYWVFNATLRNNGTPVTTRGRETQVLLKEKGNWKLALVHYSEMPAKSE